MEFIILIRKSRIISSGSGAAVARAKLNAAADKVFSPLDAQAKYLSSPQHSPRVRSQSDLVRHRQEFHRHSAGARLGMVPRRPFRPGLSAHLNHHIFTNPTKIS